MPHTLTLSALVQALQHKKISSVELSTHYLSRIHEAKALNAFISIEDDETVLEKAREADRRIAKHENGPLTGIPFAHKDNICTSSLRTTCGSKMLSEFRSPYNATISTRLETENTIMLGKTNMDEFAMGSSNETSYFGTVQNPWNLSRVPGGSSGGSAAAVAARLVPFATGTDTGGSIRQPAAFCGVSGLKPTYGLISRYGIVAYASSLDQAGLIAPSAEDIALILPYIAGYDPQDSTSIPTDIPHYSQAIQQPMKPIKIGIPTCFFDPQIDKPIRDSVLEGLSILERAGAHIVEIELSLNPYWIPCYYSLSCAEASSNLSRYDGIRFGHQSAHANTLRDLVTNSRTEGFGAEVKRRILTGTYVLASEQFEDYYIRAQKIRRLISQELKEALTKVDVLIGPTTQTTALPFHASKTNPSLFQLSDMFTVGANLAGLPAMSIPIGFHEELPIGMQLIGRHFDETTLLHIAHTYQNHTNWHQIIPNAYLSSQSGATP